MLVFQAKPLNFSTVLSELKVLISKIQDSNDITPCSNLVTPISTSETIDSFSEAEILLDF